jgi:hypothetical protein
MLIVNREGVTYDHAFVYTGGKVYDLNSLIPPLSGVTLFSAADVNDSGEIVCVGLDQGHTRAFLLQPIEQPVVSANAKAASKAVPAIIRPTFSNTAIATLSPDNAWLTDMADVLG